MTQTAHFVLVSDATGETAEKVMQAVIMQFADASVTIEKYRYVLTREQAEDIIGLIPAHAMVCTTLVDPATREVFERACVGAPWRHIDLIGPVVQQVAAFLGARPLAQPGLRHRTTINQRRAAAIEFAVRHDDGVGLQTLDQADIVLVGVSGGGKTAISMYLATKGFRVANIPMVFGIDLPEQLDRIASQKVIGLLVSAPRLAEVREERIRRLGSRIRTGYTQPDDIAREVAAASDLFQRRGWRSVDVTALAFEEAAAAVESLVTGPAARG